MSKFKCLFSLAIFWYLTVSVFGMPGAQLQNLAHFPEGSQVADDDKLDCCSPFHPHAAPFYLQELPAETEENDRKSESLSGNHDFPVVQHFRDHHLIALRANKPLPRDPGLASSASPLPLFMLFHCWKSFLI